MYEWSSFRLYTSTLSYTFTRSQACRKKIPSSRYLFVERRWVDINNTYCYVRFCTLPQSGQETRLRRRNLTTKPEITPQQSPSTYIRLAREFEKSYWYAVGEQTTMLTAVDVFVPSCELENTEPIELLPIKLYLHSSVTVRADRYGPVPLSKWRYSEPPPSVREHIERERNRIVRERRMTFSCLVLEPIQTIQWNGESGQVRRLWVRPRIELSKASADEAYVLEVSYPEELQICSTFIPPAHD